MKRQSQPVTKPSRSKKSHPRLIPGESGYLQSVGASLRAARARRGMTRKMLASHSGVSERFLAQLESGRGNASILVLRQIARALGISAAPLLGESENGSADFLHAIEFLKRLEPSQLQKAREILEEQLGETSNQARRDRIALIGLRGAGKSTIGAMLARELNVPFLELDRLIEEASGVSLSQVFDLYGQGGFRRFERRCLEEVLGKYPRFVLATGGSLVSEPETYDRLRSACYTIWLQATPEDHMSRVIAQGDMRPMAHNPEAMSDLRRILTEREPLYRLADLSIATSGRSTDRVEQELIERLPRSNPQK
jgi:XRE family aerobic/anaerobic benzoate catabolism transcriptional regulator